MLNNLNKDNVINYLKNNDFKKLYTQELGWNNFDKKISYEFEGIKYNLSGIAEIGDFAIFECKNSKGKTTPSNIRMKLSNQLSKTQFEHLIIFTDSEAQHWYWVKREGKGKPAVARTESYKPKYQSAESLYQKLNHLYYSLEDEDDTITGATSRIRNAFDREQVTKKFYEEFKKQSENFSAFIHGIINTVDKGWYTSLMLNRLMFVYFIQKKGFLNNEPDYLKEKLQEIKQKQGSDKFYSFYRQFLLVLFHKGFSQEVKERSNETRELIGKIPYLNGGLFEEHQLERTSDIQIPDEAFEKIFEFFEKWDWHLDKRDRITEAERGQEPKPEINPDVIGHIFEKYINQKQMGAYYTKEDITEYISKNTVIPYLFEEAKKRDSIAFKPESYIWQMLKENPDRYIYDAVRHGTDKPLPEEIAQGINDVSKRTEWNKSASEDYALPTEIWREVVERRNRYQEIKSKLQNGEITDINDFITYNLDIRQFAEDVISQAESPDVIRAFYFTIAGHRREQGTNQKEDIPAMSILDPTCGSGAFLFAALNILEKLYESCIEKMEAFREENPNRHKDFEKILEEIRKHPNRQYFIYKSIILNNLYGVDIMNEAVEIAKLRLFLKLASCAEVDLSHENCGLEPLPDIDFNIRAGNSLIGFANYKEVEDAVKFSGNNGQTALNLFDPMPEIDDEAEKVAKCFDRFKEMQTQEGISHESIIEAKKDLQSRLDDLNKRLNDYLAKKYLINTDKEEDYEGWKDSHEPFHWFVEFYDVVHRRGGFDVIIGNPPYLEQREVAYKILNLKTVASQAIHTMCMERSNILLQNYGAMSMILPLSIVSTQRMKKIQEIIEENRSLWYANFSWRPAKLFDNVNRALTIFISKHSNSLQTFSTTYQKWTSESREGLMERINYTEVDKERPEIWIPKLSLEIEYSIQKKIQSNEDKLSKFYALKPNNHKIFYRTTGGLYWKIFTNFSPAFRVNGKEGHSSRETNFCIINEQFIEPTIAILSSNTFWWWYTITSNCRDLNPYDLQNFPVPKNILEEQKLISLGKKYIQDLISNSSMLERIQKQTGKTETQCFKIQKSKPIIDEIDKVLAEHYGFTDEELDYIINYDIKYRMGKELEDDE